MSKIKAFQKQAIAPDIMESLPSTNIMVSLYVDKSQDTNI